MFPHEKKWIRKLSDFNYSNQDFRLNLINDTIVLGFGNDQKPFNIIYDKKGILIEDEMIEYYKLLPMMISPKLKNGQKLILLNQIMIEDYLNKILNIALIQITFTVFHLSMNGNDYEKFFFENKTGLL